MKKIFTLSFLVLSSSLFILKAQSGIITTVAGDGIAGFGGDNTQATTAKLDQDGGVAIDSTGNIYIGDSQNNRIRKVATTGIITTFAGTGVNGYSGDGGQATAARCSYPIGVRVDKLGNVYFSDAGNNCIRKVNTSGRISTIAGNANFNGYSGDGGQATAAEMNYPVGISVDINLNVYIADQVNNVIRKVNTAGIITTVAGKGPLAGGFSGNGGQATNAELNQPTGVAVDNSGNMYIADYNNSVVRAVNTSGIISTLAGNTVNGFNYFAGRPDTLELANPTGVSVDSKGHVYIADAGNAVIWEDFIGKNQMYVIAGIVDGAYSGDGGPAYAAEINYAFDCMPDKNNNVYIADLGNSRIRKITAGCGGVGAASIGIYNFPECHGVTDGILVGFPASNFEPFTYVWSPGSQTNDTINNLAAGVYTLTVTDAMGCTETATADITQPTAIVVTTGSNYSVCQGSDVLLSGSASGGVGSLTYIWDLGNTTDTVTVAPTGPTTYTLYAFDGNGCVDSNEANVTVNALPNVILNAASYSVCTTDTADTLYGSPAGGTYSGTAVIGNIFNPSVAGVGTWNFTYTYTDGNGCTAVGLQSVIVTVCAGVPGIKNGAKMSVYPNPAKNEFTVELPGNNDAQLITMYTVTGQQVYEHKFNPTENSQLTSINTRNFLDGVYFLKVIMNDGSTLVQKIDIVK